MSIRYFLRPNKLPTNPDAYVAHVKPWGTLMEEDIINRMQRQGSTITRENIRDVFIAYGARASRWRK